MSGWPFPGDSPPVRLRKVALAYRQALNLVAPKECATLDAVMLHWGETWIVPRIQRFDPDDWVGVADAAELGNVSTTAIGVARQRGRISARKVDGRWEYQVRDVLRLSTDVRRRRKRHDSDAG